jgi:hypothetical protein
MSQGLLRSIPICILTITALSDMLIDCGSSSSGKSFTVIISGEADVFSDETIDKPKSTIFQHAQTKKKHTEDYFTPLLNRKCLKGRSIEII